MGKKWEKLKNSKKKVWPSPVFLQCTPPINIERSLDENLKHEICFATRGHATKYTCRVFVQQTWSNIIIYLLCTCPLEKSRGVFHKSRIETSRLTDKNEALPGPVRARWLNAFHEGQARLRRHDKVKPDVTNSDNCAFMAFFKRPRGRSQIYWLEMEKTRAAYFTPNEQQLLMET